MQKVGRQTGIQEDTFGFYKGFGRFYGLRFWDRGPGRYIWLLQGLW